MTPREVSDLCASFQRVVSETLVDRTFEAARWIGARSVAIAGGVSANSRLRRDARTRGERDGLPVFVPALSARDRQRGDDRRRGPAAPRARRALDPRLQVDARCPIAGARS
jgi:hypothetical protein